MEDTLRGDDLSYFLNTTDVLILVLMEDTLRGIHIFCRIYFLLIVLILVLMEDTLRVILKAAILNSVQCLNPCFNGRYSQRVTLTKMKKKQGSLNPCFNGRYSQSKGALNDESKGGVLILVLMEDTLRDY